MKRKIFTALLSLVAIVGVSFATVPPTIKVHPLAILVEPNNQFGFLATYTNTNRFYVVIREAGQEGQFDLLINEETKNILTESQLIVTGTMTLYNSTREYIFVVENEEGDRSEVHAFCITIAQP